MNRQHADLASGRLKDMTLSEQMANIGSEVSRALNWRKKGNEFSSSETLWRSYFDYFNYAAQQSRAR